MEYLPVKPQWAPASIPVIEKLLSKEKVVFEWGTGLSTPWIAERAKFVFTMDDDHNWRRRINAICQRMNISNVDFSVYHESEEKYLEAIYWFSEMGGIDIAIVDGVRRSESFKTAIKYVKVNGLIIFDDFERYDFEGQLRNFPIVQQQILGTQQKTAIFRKNHV